MRYGVLTGVLAITFVLGACATVPPSPLTLTSAQQLRLDHIDVAVAPDANVSWGNAEHEFVASERNQGRAPKPQPKTATRLSDPQTADADADRALAGSPEGKAYVRDKIKDRLGQALDQRVKSRLQAGQRSTRLEVTVKSFVIPSAIQRVLIGGVPVIVASAVLKDSATGEVIAERKDMGSIAIAGNGWGGVLADQFFDDLDVRVVDNYAQQFHEWLVPKA